MQPSRSKRVTRDYLVAILPALIVCSRAPSPGPHPAAANGLWEGTFVARGRSHALTLEICDTATPNAFVDVPDQYARRYRVSELALSGDTLRFTFPANLPPARFVGSLERGRIRGAFAAPVEGDSVRGTFELWRRPPASPPHRTIDVDFRNGDVPLHGTLFLPRGVARAPAVVFLHGSGPQTRESYLRWFADYFARRGVASLVYDKRNTGRSDIPPWEQGSGTFSELSDDAVAAARVLRARPEIDPSRVGFWGLSQGAWLAPMAARRARGAFVVMISGGGVSPAEQELYDDEMKLSELGYSRAVIDSALDLLRDADRYVRTGADAEWTALQAHLSAVRTRPWFPMLDRFPLVLPREAGAWRGLRPDLDYDPRPTLASLDTPVLVILGERDPLTPAAETARRIDSTFRAADNRAVTLRLVSGADHGLWVPTGRGVSWLEQGPAPGWVDAMAEWIGRTPPR